MGLYGPNSMVVGGCSFTLITCTHVNTCQHMSAHVRHKSGTWPGLGVLFNTPRPEGDIKIRIGLIKEVHISGGVSELVKFSGTE